jgi:cold shock CspA family protein
MLSSERQFGVVARFDRFGRYGFIRQDSRPADIFFRPHDVSPYSPYVAKGTRVSFQFRRHGRSGQSRAFDIRIEPLSL